MHEEAMRRGLECSAELPLEERQAICDQAEAELKAADVDTDPFGVDKPKPAARVLGLFDRLALEQEEFDRAVRAAGPVFDREAAFADMEEVIQRRLVERRREAEEFRLRWEAMEAEGRTRA